jgi:uncharacterized protein with HEPN domain
MPVREDDLVRLKAMHDAARRALTFAEGRARVDLDTDLALVLFTKKALEIIGTAALKTTRECKRRHVGFPWTSVAGFRKRSTRHKVLGEGELDRMWAIVTAELPHLAGLLEGMLAQENDDDENPGGG